MRRLATTTLFLGTITLPLALPAQKVDAPVRYDEDYLSADFHRSRRAAVVAKLPGNALVVLFGAPMRNRSNDMDYEYRQASDFLYLTGSEEPGSALIMAPGGLEVDGERVHEILFVPPRDPEREVWDGRRFGTERAMQRLGVRLALDATRFEEILVPLLQTGQHRVYYLGVPDGVQEQSALHDQLAAFMDNVAPDALAVSAVGGATPLREILDELRAIKSDEEMTALRRAIDITTEAHREVMQQVRAGWAEYENEALVEYTFKRNGSEQPGFNSIVGSGENSTILHYMTNRRVTEAGDVVVIDIGAEVHGYSADVTRTIPVSGTYSPEQRAIYEIVYSAQEAGIRATRAGNPFFASNSEASRVLAAGLAELGLISSPSDMNGLRRFFMHGTSHYLGLDVHDVGSYGPLRAGEVVTVEPGIYIPVAEDIDPKWWNIGVRIEDDVLVTDGDPVILSAGAPRQIDDVEALMRTIS